MQPYPNSIRRHLHSVDASGIPRVTILFLRSRGPARQSLSSGQVIFRMKLWTQGTTLGALGEFMEGSWNAFSRDAFSRGQGCLTVSFVLFLWLLISHRLLLSVDTIRDAVRHTAAHLKQNLPPGAKVNDEFTGH